MRVGVLSHLQNSADSPERYVSKSAAACLIRRQLAHSVARHLIRMVEPRLMVKALPNRPQTQATRIPGGYEHHIEPKIIPLTINNSGWQRYMQGL